MMDLHTAWAIIIVFAILMYTIFDGFDLGTGILLLLFRKEQHRDVMVDTITPVWDGNETWLVLAGVGLFGGFPLAYGTVLPALYLPFIIMILSLAFRALSMEFRFLAGATRHRWDMIFSVASLLAAFCQGLILGNLIDGVMPRTAAHTGLYPFGFLTPFACVTGFLVILLYALIGSNWLILKTDGTLQAKLRRIGLTLSFWVTFVGALLFAVRKFMAAFAPRLAYHGTNPYLGLHALFWYILIFALMIGIAVSIFRKYDQAPFLLCILLFICLGAVVVSHQWPIIVPPFMSIYQAGSPAYGNTVLLYSSFVVIPVILTYVSYSYIVFRGKAKAQTHYEPVLAADLQELHNHGRKGREVKQKIINLGWPLRILLSITWLGLFFIILGFLGDGAALGLIGLMNAVFLIFWYRKSRREQQTDQS